MALVVFVLCCAGLMGWLLFADGPGATVSTEAPMDDEAALAADAMATPPKLPAAKPAALVQPAPKPSRRPPAATRPLHRVLPAVRASGPAPPDEEEQGMDIEGNIDRADARAVGRFVLPRVKACFADHRITHPISRGELRVEVGVHNDGAAAALVNDSRLAEDPFADPSLELCIRRALDGKAVPVGALTIDARVAFPIALGF